MARIEPLKATKRLGKLKKPKGVFWTDLLETELIVS